MSVHNLPVNVHVKMTSVFLCGCLCACTRVCVCECVCVGRWIFEVCAARCRREDDAHHKHRLYSTLGGSWELPINQHLIKALLVWKKGHCRVERSEQHSATGTNVPHVPLRTTERDFCGVSDLCERSLDSSDLIPQHKLLFYVKFSFLTTWQFYCKIWAHFTIYRCSLCITSLP